MNGWRDTYPFHPVADIFPMLEGESYRDLVEDIRSNGLREPIWLHQNGSIIDGRNRYRACRAAQVEPSFRVFEGSDEELTSFVLSLNLHRRHLNEAQRAMVAAKMRSFLLEQSAARQRAGLRPSRRPAIDREAAQDAAPPVSANLHARTPAPAPAHPSSAPSAPPARSPGDTATQAGEALNIGRRSVVHAATVQAKGVPELQEQAWRGEVAISSAAAVASLPPARQIAVVAGGGGAIQAEAKKIRERSQRTRHGRAGDRHDRSGSGWLLRAEPLTPGKVEPIDAGEHDQVAYFENAQGEQLVFVADEAEPTARLYHGGRGWRCFAVTSANLPPEMGAAGEEERAFVALCWGVHEQRSSGVRGPGPTGAIEVR